MKFKKCVAGLLIVTAAVFLSLYLLYRNAGGVIKYGFNQFAPQITKVETHIDHVFINPWSGRGSIHGFFLGNPKGFQSDSAVRVDKISITVHLASLAKAPIDISDIEINGPLITWEGSLTDSNLLQIQNNLGHIQNQKDQNSNAMTSVKIKKLRIKNAKIRISVFGGEPKILSLPDIELANLGGASGTSFQQITFQVLNEITTYSVREIVKLPEAIKEIGEKLFNDLKKWH